MGDAKGEEARAARAGARGDEGKVAQPLQMMRAFLPTLMLVRRGVAAAQEESWLMETTMAQWKKETLLQQPWKQSSRHC